MLVQHLLKIFPTKLNSMYPLLLELKLTRNERMNQLKREKAGGHKVIQRHVKNSVLQRTGFLRRIVGEERRLILRN